MRHVSHKYKISTYKTSAYRPQSNGSIERSHLVLIEYLKQWSQKHDWDKYVTYATKAYNTNVYEEMKYTPLELVFGRVARIPTSSTLASDKSNESYSEYATALFNRIFDAQASARKNEHALEHAKFRSKQYYDRKINSQVFNKDDYVYFLKETLKGKFDEQYKGPYKILETLGNNNVKLAISDKWTRIVHSDKLKICRTRPTEPP